MKPQGEMRLNRQQISGLSSRYIDEGVKKDCWEILDMNISGNRVKARLRMSSYFVSPTDPSGFHLTIFSTQEFLAQLSNIFLQVVAGYEVKTRETWMRECTITSRRAIRDPENIMVDMEFMSIKKLGGAIVSSGKSRVYDDRGGLFIARLKGLIR